MIYDLIIWFSHIHKIGGIETAVFNLVKKISTEYKILVLYNEADENQLKRLEPFCSTEKYNKRNYYEGKTFISETAWGGYPEMVHSTKNIYIQIIHADFSAVPFKYIKWNRTNKHYAVSETARDAFVKLYGLECGVLYNLLDDIQSTKPILKLITATRLTKEKGYDRMIEFANFLNKNGVEFRWYLLSDPNEYGVKKYDIKGLIYMDSRLDWLDYLKESDYLVQLSDTESWCYSVNEALQYGIPVIVTNFKSAKESVTNGKNGYIIKLDMSDMNSEFLDNILNHKPKNFEYIPKGKKEHYISILELPPEKETEISLIEVTAKMTYYDCELCRSVKLGEKIFVTEHRKNELKSKGVIV